MEQEIFTTEEFLIELGKKLKSLRENMNYTQSDVSEEIGLSRQTINSIEHGKNFSVESLIKLLVTYNYMDRFLNLISLPHNFDYEIYKAELRDFNKKYKNTQWFKQKFGDKQ